MSAESNIFAQLQNAVRAGEETLARKAFPIGTVIPDIWVSPKTKDQYQMPLIVAHYGEVDLPDYTKRLGVFLLRKNALPKQDCLLFDDGHYEKSSLHASLNGDYLTGCSPQLLEVISETVISVEDSTGWIIGVPAKFFIPSIQELGADPYKDSDFERVVWDYFKDTPSSCRASCEKRVFRDPSGVARPCWSRSCVHYNDSLKWSVFWHGDVTSWGTDIFEFDYAPACVIA